MKGAYLVTGADGYLGLRTLARLLATEESPMIGWVRSSNADEFAKKSTHIHSTLEQQGISAQRLRLVAGDLRDETPFEQVPAREIGRILHTAAVTRFNVEEDVSQAVNVCGSEKLFAFAETCPDLDHLVHVSTVYASGKQRGGIAESQIPNAPVFSNFYEQSKWRAEDALIHRFGSLPYTVARVATVIADDESGTVTQYNAVHNTLKLLYYGWISLVPGEGSTPLYFVTGSFCDQALSRLLSNPWDPNRRFLHLCHSRSETLTLESLLEVVYRVFDRDADFAKRRILRPLLTDETSFELLASEMGAFTSGVVGQAIGSIRPFAKQLYVPKDFENQTLRNLLGSDYRAPDPTLLAKRVTEYLTATKWGRR